MRQSFAITSAPAAEPVSVSEVKQYLRVDGSSDDDLLTDMIVAARGMAEEYLRRSLITQTVKLTMDWFPRRENGDWWDGVREIAISELSHEEDYIKLPMAPIQSISSIVTYSDGNQASTFSASNYRLDAAGARVMLNDGQVWPSDLRARQAVEITYVAGYGDEASDVPAAIRQAIMQMVNSLYNSRGCDSGISDSAKMLMRPYRIIDETHNGLR